MIETIDNMNDVRRFAATVNWKHFWMCMATPTIHPWMEAKPRPEQIRQTPEAAGVAPCPRRLPLVLHGIREIIRFSHHIALRKERVLANDVYS